LVSKSIKNFEVIYMEEKEELNTLGLEDQDIYTEEGVTTKLEDESIDSSEEGFMIGYLAA
jgi:hypothetical protein